MKSVITLVMVIEITSLHETNYYKNGNIKTILYT